MTGQLLNKERVSLESSVFSEKGSALFRSRIMSHPLVSAKLRTSSSSSRLSSVSKQLLRKSSNRIADANNTLLMHALASDERTITPVRYNSPAAPISSVFTIDGQMANESSNPEDGSSMATSRSLISFKNLALIHTRLKSEMGDSRVKLNAQTYETDHRVEQMDEIAEGK